MSTAAKTVDVNQYIARFPKETVKRLTEIRKLIKKIVPTAEETISYGIPCFKKDKSYIVFFAGYTNHISVYPIPKAPELQKEILTYKTGKGTMQFPLDKPLPMPFITKIVKQLAKEHALRVKAKKTNN